MEINRVLARVRALGRYRDAFLVLASTVYVVGFSIWSLVAWRLGLGPMPVLDAQYFVAGLPPLFAVCLVVMVIKVARFYLLEQWPQFVGQLSRRQQLVVYAALFVLFIAAGACLDESATIAPFVGVRPDTIESAGMVLAFLALILIPWKPLATWFDSYAKTQPPASVRTPVRLGITLVRNQLQSWDMQQRRYVFLIPIVAGMFAIYLYVTAYYIAIPQVLGGGKPRCAALDVKVADLSAATISDLGVARRDKEATAQTPRLDVYFAGHDTILVGVRSARGRAVFELPRDSVTAIRWCD